MKYLFVHICNALSRDGSKGTISRVWFDAVIMLCAGTLSWLGVFVALFYFYVLNRSFPTLQNSLVIVSIPFILFYYLLIKDKKYEAILKEYQDETPQQNKAGKIAGFIYIFTPMILGILLSLIWHNKL